MVAKIGIIATELVLIYLPAKLLCVVPFNINLKTGKASNSLLGSFVVILSGIFYYAFHLYSAYQQMISQQDTNFVSKLIDSYNQYAGCSILMIIILNSCYHQSKVVQVINTIQQVDDILRELNQTESTADRFRLQFHGPAYLFVTAICTMEYYFCIMFIKDTPTFSTYCLLMCYVPLLVHITTELLFCALLSCITNRLSKLKQLQQSLVITTETIRPFKRMFDALHGAADQLNQSFQIPILLLTFHQFTAITTLSYDLAVAIVKYDYLTPGYDSAKIIVQLESSGGWSLFFIAETCILCLICERFKKKLAHTGSRLLLATTTISTQHGNHRWTQLQMHGTTMNEFVNSACGLFHVDMHLLFNMIGVITTYLIILVQFDVAQRQTITSSSGN